MNGSGSAGKDDPEWFIIVNPVLSDTNGGIHAVCSSPLDTSFADTNMDEFNSENEVEEHIEYECLLRRTRKWVWNFLRKH